MNSGVAFVFRSIHHEKSALGRVGDENVMARRPWRTVIGFIFAVLVATPMPGWAAEPTIPSAARQHAVLALEKALDAAEAMLHPGTRLTYIALYIHTFVRHGPAPVRRRVETIARNAYSEIDAYFQRGWVGAFAKILMYTDHEDEAIRLAAQFPTHRDLILDTMVSAYVGMGRTTHALTLAKFITQPEYQAMARNSILRSHLSLGEIEAAQRIADALTDASERDEALGQIAEALADAGAYQLAMDAYGRISSPRHRMNALIDISRAMGKAEKSEASFRPLALAESVVGAMSAKNRLPALLSLVEAHMDFRQPQQAARLRDALGVAWAGIPKGEERDAAAMIFAEAQARTGEVKAALATARKISNENRRQSLLKDVIGILGKLGRYNEALILAATITDSRKRAGAMWVTAGYLGKRLHFRRAFAVARDIGITEYKYSALAELARVIFNVPEAASMP